MTSRFPAPAPAGAGGGSIAAAVPLAIPLPAPAVAAPARARIALLGASGYAGVEFTRLALEHPGLELVLLGSREPAARAAGGMFPGLDLRVAPLPPVVGVGELAGRLEAGEFDTLVACLPHGAWRALAAQEPRLARGPARIVDLSADFRDGGDGYVYGLPEAFRDAIAGAVRLANPGCYPTAATLALLPVAGWLAGPVAITAVSGVSGAGRGAALRTSFTELSGGAALYRAGSVHAHVPEIERNLARLGGAAHAVGFAPMLVPMARGILLTASAPLARPFRPEEVQAAYALRYAGERFVRVLPPGEWPETRCVRGSNRCDLAVTTLHGGTTLLAAAAMDNLIKGAAGQAVQNLNRMLGWPEEQGLPVHGSPW